MVLVSPDNFPHSVIPNIRYPQKAVAIFTLEQYVEQRMMTVKQCQKIKSAVAEHRNILVVGGTGSGKTTLVNAIINEMVNHDPSERIFIIEDTGEIQCAAENFVQYHTSLDVSMTFSKQRCACGQIEYW